MKREPMSDARLKEIRSTVALCGPGYQRSQVPISIAAEDLLAEVDRLRSLLSAPSPQGPVDVLVGALEKVQALALRNCPVCGAKPGWQCEDGFEHGARNVIDGGEVLAIVHRALTAYRAGVPQGERGRGESGTQPSHTSPRSGPVRRYVKATPPCDGSGMFKTDGYGNLNDAAGFAMMCAGVGCHPENVGAKGLGAPQTPKTAESAPCPCGDDGRPGHPINQWCPGGKKRTSALGQGQGKAQMIPSDSSLAAPPKGEPPRCSHLHSGDYFAICGLCKPAPTAGDVKP